MKYHYDFQHLRKGAARPDDDGMVVDAQIDDNGFALMPTVGDFVDIVEMPGNEGRAHFSGRVKSRLFRYFGDKSCSVNIIVEELSDEEVNWGLLIKE